MSVFIIHRNLVLLVRPDHSGLITIGILEKPSQAKFQTIAALGVMSGRKAGNRRLTKRPSGNVSKAQLHKSLYGVKNRGLADPPPFTQIPWWQVTISQPYTNNNSNSLMDITPKTIVDCLKSQTGLTQSNESISLRIKSLSVWSYGGPFVNLSCKDLAVGGTSNDHLTLIEDNEAKNRFANVHFWWPVSQQQLAFSGSDTTLLAQIGTKAADTGTWRAQVLWSLRVQTAPNRIQEMQSRIDELERKLENLSSK